MTSWRDLDQLRPDLTAAGRALLYQFGVGLAFLATTRADGGPRLHPICPQICEGGLFAFIVPSPKRSDLLRDGRFALHTFPCAENEDAFSLTGRAHPVEDDRTREDLARQFLTERKGLDIAAPDDQQQLFVFDIESCMLTRTTGHGDPHPTHTVWRLDNRP